MGHYCTDAAELARLNAGLPPDEWATSFYVEGRHERAARERREAAADAQARYIERVQATHRWREGRASLADLRLLDGAG